MLAKPQTFMNASGESVSKLSEIFLYLLIIKFSPPVIFVWFWWGLVGEGWGYRFLLQDSIKASSRGKHLAYYMHFLTTLFFL